MLWLWIVGALAGPRTLHVGNSYTYGNDLPMVTHSMMAHTLSKRAPTDVTGSSVARGGWRLEQHAADMLTEGEPLNDHLHKDTTFEYVYIQEQSQIPGFPQSHSAWTSSQRSAHALHEASAATGADTLMLATWGRRSGDAQNATRFPDFLTMNNLLEQGTLDMVRSAQEPGMFIAPVGRAFAAVHQHEQDRGVDPQAADSLFSRLYAGDGSHPSTLGTWLMAAVLTESSVGYAPDPQLDILGLDVDDKLVLLEAANSAVIDHPLDLPFAWVVPLDIDDPTYVVTATERRELAYTYEELDGKNVQLEGSGAGLAELWIRGSSTLDEVQITQGTLQIGNGAVSQIGSVQLNDGGLLHVTEAEAVVQQAQGEGHVVVDANGSLTLTDSERIDLVVEGTARFGPQPNLRGMVAGAQSTITLDQNGTVAVDGVAHLSGKVLFTGELQADQHRVLLEANELVVDTEDLANGLEVEGNTLVISGPDHTSRVCGTASPRVAWTMVLPLLLIAGRRRFSHQLSSN